MALDVFIILVQASDDYLDGVDRVQHETSLEGPILEDVEETIAREEVELGISPPEYPELDEGEFEDLDIEHVDCWDSCVADLVTVVVVVALLRRLCRCVDAVVVLLLLTVECLNLEGLIPFRRRVFDSARDDHRITAKMLEDKIKSKQFFTIKDKDAVSLFLLAILELVLLGQ
ncbi:hypothetical protein Tco_0353483 [Tanacetum coccineum]